MVVSCLDDGCCLLLRSVLRMMVVDAPVSTQPVKCVPWRGFVLEVSRWRYDGISLNLSTIESFFDTIAEPFHDGMVRLSDKT